jgi:hypothetical protein
MPISADQFDHLGHDTPTFEEGTDACNVLSFLIENRDKAFKQGEISDAIGISSDSTSVVVIQLEKLGIVEHKGQYWRAAPDYRIASFETALISQQTIADHYGDEEFDKEQWLKHAPDKQE